MPSTVLQAANLNLSIPAQQAYWQRMAVPTTATGLAMNQPTTGAVLLPASGAPPVFVLVNATTVNCGAGSVSQDNYVDMTPAGAFVVTTVAAGGTPSAPAAGNLRLYKATTNSGNTAVQFPVTVLAATAPQVPYAVQTNGSGALSPFTLPATTILNAGVQANAAPTTQVVPGTTTLDGDTVLQGLLRQGAARSGSDPNTIKFQVGPAGIPISIGPVTTGPGGVCTFTTPGYIPSAGSYAVLQAVGVYNILGTNLLYPFGYRTHGALTSFLISEVGTQTTQPGLWVGSITSASVVPSSGNGTSPQTWYTVNIMAKVLLPNVTYRFVYLPLFG